MSARFSLSGIGERLASVERRLVSIVRPKGLWLILFLHGLHCRWQLIRPTWFCFLTVILVIAAFLVPQIQDVLLVAGEDTIQILLLFLGLLVFSVTAWYCARANLYVDFKLLVPNKLGTHQWSPPMEPAKADKWRRRVPRVLGAAVPSAIGAIYLWNSMMHGQGSWNILYGIASLLLAAILYIGFVARGTIIRRRGAPGRFTLLQSRLPTRTFRVLGTLLAANTVLLGLIVWLPKIFPSIAALPVYMGAPSLFLIAAASWLAFGSFVLVYPTYRFRLTPPLALVALFLPVACNLSPWRSTDHVVRDLTTDQDVATSFAKWRNEQRKGITGQLTSWLAERKPAFDKASADNPYPVFILTAEGGGIRAAYWTAAVLAELEDRMPGFACHVFAISGVSGGSVGAAVYAGLVADKVSQGQLDCGRRYRIPDKSDTTMPGLFADGKMLESTTSALGKDFLAPALAGLLYPDLVQRFLPVSLLPDRAFYLETAWEAAWPSTPLRGADASTTCPGAVADLTVDKTKSKACNWMSGPFHGLWQDSKRDDLVPSLFLNTTEVESGRRLIVSNVSLFEKTNGEESWFNEATDAFAPDSRGNFCEKGGPENSVPISKPIPLSTAAGLSARFTYVSPPATLHNCIRVVDGGYHENYGALTAQDIVEGLENAKIDPADKARLSLVVISLVNSNFESLSDDRNSVAGEAQESAAANAGARHGNWVSKSFHETWAPIATVLGTRTARGEQALADLKAHMKDHFIRIDLLPPGSRPLDGKAEKSTVRTFPLGWMLAPSTVEEMKVQAKAVVQEVMARDRNGLAQYADRSPAGAGGEGPTAGAPSPDGKPADAL